jgi:glutathionylspermidine synthase
LDIHVLEQRPNMDERHKEIGFSFADIDGKYWDETLAVEFSQNEIDTLEQAAQECHEMALSATKELVESGNDQHLIDIGIPQNMIPLIRQSWERKEPSFYGRFDFALNFENGNLVPKCYEYNADTPTSLFEASIVQWQWLQDMGMPDQFNFIHERLVEHFSELVANKKIRLSPGADFYLTSEDCKEDLGTIRYLQDVLHEVGLSTNLIEVSQIALADNGWSFLDARNENDVKPIEAIFKLYPWERFALGEFFKAVPTSQTKWTEPAWKLVMSSKGLLAKMYQMFPESPWLIPTRLASGGEVASLSNTAMRLPLQDHEHDNFVVKPCLSREGSGVHVFKGEQVIKAKDCEFNSAQHVIQDYVPSHKIEEGTIMAGVWVVGDVACGLGIRLDGEITGDLARFLPHFFV